MIKGLFSEVRDSNLRSFLLNPEASFALACWDLARRDQAFPQEAEFLRHKMEWLAPDMMVIRLDSDGAFFYSTYGIRIAQHAGFDMTGRKVSDFKGALGSFYLDLYNQAIREQRAIGSVHRLGNFNERPMWERVILPVWQADGKIALYVVNCVRKLADDFSQISARAKSNGIIALQFLRSPEGDIVDALIFAANNPALAMTERRLDEMLDRSIRDCFPGIISHQLWEKYLIVGETREEMSFLLDYRQDGLDGVFDVRLAPFRDGVVIDFRVKVEEVPCTSQGGNAQGKTSHGVHIAA